MNRHCLTMTARAELNLWSKYWSRAVVGGGVLYILYCGVYILKWVAAFFLSIYHRCCLHKPSHSHWQGKCLPRPRLGVICQDFHLHSSTDELTPQCCWWWWACIYLFHRRSWVWDHIYLLGLRLGPYLRCTRAPPLSSPSQHCSLLQSTLLHQTLLSFHQAGTSTTRPIYHILLEI